MAKRLHTPNQSRLSRDEIKRRREAVRKTVQRPFGAAECERAGFDPRLPSGQAFVRTYRGLRVAGISHAQAVRAAKRAARARQIEPGMKKKAAKKAAK
jgi:hypothetical protein